jgi:hypothetical protein
MIYRILLGVFFFLKPQRRALSVILDSCIKSGINKINYQGYRIFIDFGNGYTMHAWNANKFYSWLSDGTVKDGEELIYKWEDERPRAKTMYKLNRLITSYYATTIK